MSGLVTQGDFKSNFDKAEKVQDAFTAIDKDGDGQLTFQEFMAACKVVFRVFHL